MKCNFYTLLLPCLFIFSNINAQNVTLRFSTPTPVDCPEATVVCYDVEAQADQPAVLLDELNIRMYIDDDKLTFVDFRNPDPSYFLEQGGTAVTGAAGAGQSFFGFTGEFVYILDNFKRVGATALELATGPDWSYLYQACFESANVDWSVSPVCGPLVWDHDTDGSGFASGSDGVEMIAVNPAGGPGIALEEAVEHTGWTYYMVDPQIGDCIFDPCALIPITLTKFTVDSDDCKEVLINWSTEAEFNNEKFVIQRKTEFEAAWTDIAEVAGQGNSTQTHHYQFYDQDITKLTGAVYYRLMQVDSDLATSSSHVAIFDNNCRNENFHIFPNPTREYIILELNEVASSQSIDLKIFNSVGKQLDYISINNITGINEISKVLDVSDFAPGQYFVHIKSLSHFKALPFTVVD